MVDAHEFIKDSLLPAFYLLLSFFILDTTYWVAFEKKLVVQRIEQPIMYFEGTLKTYPLPLQSFEAAIHRRGILAATRRIQAAAGTLFRFDWTYTTNVTYPDFQL